MCLRNSEMMEHQNVIFGLWILSLSLSLSLRGPLVHVPQGGAVHDNLSSPTVAIEKWLKLHSTLNLARAKLLQNVMGARVLDIQRCTFVHAARVRDIQRCTCVHAAHLLDIKRRTCVHDMRRASDSQHVIKLHHNADQLGKRL